VEPPRLSSVRGVSTRGSAEQVATTSKVSGSIAKRSLDYLVAHMYWLLFASDC
jgi:hypothetical protein